MSARHGCRYLLVHYNSIDCNQSATMNAEHLPDDRATRPLGARTVCALCGAIGADVRRDRRPFTNGPASP